jgi:hypothetical protein
MAVSSMDIRFTAWAVNLGDDRSFGSSGSAPEGNPNNCFVSGHFLNRLGAAVELMPLYVNILDKCLSRYEYLLSVDQCTQLLSELWNLFDFLPALKN